MLPLVQPVMQFETCRRLLACYIVGPSLHSSSPSVSASLDVTACDVTLLLFLNIDGPTAAVESLPAVAEPDCVLLLAEYAPYIVLLLLMGFD